MRGDGIAIAKGTQWRNLNLRNMKLISLYP